MPPVRPRHRRVLATALAAALALALGACGSTATVDVPSAAPAQASVSLPDVAPGRAGAVSEVRGAPGGLLLLYFGYTACPDVCPTTMSDLGAAIHALPADVAARVEPAMITLDPAGDTPEVMQGWLGHFFDRYRAYRPADVAGVLASAKAFGAQVGIDGEPGTPFYHVRHSGGVYAVDDAGRILHVWPFGATPEEIADDVRGLVAGLDAPGAV